MRGVFWRQYLDWAVENVPTFVEPIVMAAYTTFFFLFWGPGRRAVARNLGAIFPESSAVVNLGRAWRVFWNFAWTFTDTARFNLQRLSMDWEFEGLEHFRDLVSNPSGSVLLTAHMGNYDLGSYLFAERTERTISIVRAPETDPESEAFSSRKRAKAVSEGFRIHYSTDSRMVALDLLEAIRGGEIVAIQGDRAIPGVSSFETEMFGLRVKLPSGPFALAMATRTRIYPLFITRAGRRRYRLVALEPIECRRAGRDRDRDLREATSIWTTALERTIRRHWSQWFTFEHFGVDEER